MSINCEFIINFSNTDDDDDDCLHFVKKTISYPKVSHNDVQIDNPLSLKALNHIHAGIAKKMETAFEGDCNGDLQGDLENIRGSLCTIEIKNQPFNCSIVRITVIKTTIGCFVVPDKLDIHVILTPQ